MGTVASALEVVPLTLIGVEVVKSLNISQYCGSFGEKNF
jgi:nitric oxide reductase large subunit